MASAVPSWETHRQQTEGLVNDTFKIPRTEQDAAELVMTFNSRRKFKQVQDKQHRASEEKRFLGTQRRALGGGGATRTGNSSSFAGTASQRLGAGSAPATIQARSRGAGSHSLQSMGGVRGHFHNTSAAQQADERHRWPISIAPMLDGEHIDHSKAVPVKDDPKLSKMNAEERSRQFSCYFRKEDNFARKCASKTEATGDASKHQDWRAPVFRGDLPQRHGKFGRRVFDPQVKERPTKNPYGISEIESQPVENFFHQQERVHEYLDRALPSGQERHFQQYLPRCEFPTKMEDMSTREQIRSFMDGDQKVPILGFGQNRHSDPSDLNVYTRPLGTSQLDRLVPLA